MFEIIVEEDSDFEGVDEICSSIENLPDVEFITNITTSISAPLV